MSTSHSLSSNINTEAPLSNFSNCHTGIATQLASLAALPELTEAAEKARVAAEGTLALFKNVVYEHHADEERELFPAVLQSASPGAEHDRVQVMVQRLTAEHRAVEALWKILEPHVKAAAKGKASEELNRSMVAELVKIYLGHAQLEETEFLPLAAEILGRNGNHMAALGLSLHIRHTKLPAGYI
jgi:hemerythrin-like domain-containing protein